MHQKRSIIGDFETSMSIFRQPTIRNFACFIRPGTAPVGYKTFGLRHLVHQYSTASTDDAVLLKLEGSKATLTLNRPRVGNSLDFDMIQTLGSHLEDLRVNDAVRAVVLTGNGRFFCTGMDLGKGGQGMAGDSEAQFERAQKIYRGLGSFPKPTIALIQGSCYGGGNGLAMACDLRIAARADITFTLSEVKIGFAPAIISQYIVREWGVSKAREAMLRARPVTAQELLAINALHYITNNQEEADAKVNELVAELHAGGPDAQALCKRLVDASATESDAEAQNVIKDVFVEMLRPSPEGKYGLECFQAKKKPDWTAFHQRLRVSEA